MTTSEDVDGAGTSASTQPTRSIVSDQGHEPASLVRVQESRSVTAFKSFFQRDPRLIRHKATYFAVFMSLVLYVPFVPVFLAQVGLTKGQVGVIMAISPACQTLAGPIWTWLADKYGLRRTIMIVPAIIATIGRCLLPQLRSFGSIFALVLGIEFFYSPMVPMFDASSMALLEATIGTAEYGKLRLWGAISWGIFSFIAGAVTDRYGVAAAFYMHPIASAMAILLLWTIPVVQERHGVENKPITDAAGPTAGGVSDIEQPSGTNPSAPATAAPPPWYSIFGRLHVVIFFLVSFLMGLIFAGVFCSYLFLWLGELGGSRTLMGLTLTVTCIAEVPFYFFASTIIRRMGVVATLLLACACFVIRSVWYALLQDPWWTLPADALQGVTFALMWAASTKYVHELVPPEATSIAQALLNGIEFGAGAGVGSIVGGFIYDGYGARTLFWATAALSVLATLIMCYAWLSGRTTNKAVKLKDVEVSDGESGSPEQPQSTT